MVFYIQHGYGKSDKLSSLAEVDLLDGVILSPHSEDSDALLRTVEWIREQNAVTMIDPQTYFYSTTPQRHSPKHVNHGIAAPGINWASPPKAINELINSIGDLNSKYNPGGVRIAPSPIQESFKDLWTPLAAQLCYAASDAWGEDSTLATLAVKESALNDWSEVERWLDVATQFPVRGFYLLVDRPSAQYPPIPGSRNWMSNLLRIVYILSEVNGFEVHWGYSDIGGILGLVAGATSVSSGWSYSNRQFSSSRWVIEQSGGRPANPRVHMARLFAMPRARDEAQLLFQSDMKSRLFSKNELRFHENYGFENLTNSDVQLDYLKFLSKVGQGIARKPDLSDRLNWISGKLRDAIGLWNEIESNDLLAATSYKYLAESFLRSFDEFEKFVNP